MKRQLLKIKNGYSFWKFTQGRGVWWNIWPTESDFEPNAGYVSKEYIENVKGQKFDTPAKVTHRLNIEDMDPIEGKWRKQRDERRGIL